MAGSVEGFIAVDRFGLGELAGQGDPPRA